MHFTLPIACAPCLALFFTPIPLPLPFISVICLHAFPLSTYALIRLCLYRLLVYFPLSITSITCTPLSYAHAVLSAKLAHANMYVPSIPWNTTSGHCHAMYAFIICHVVFINAVWFLLFKTRSRSLWIRLNHSRGLSNLVYKTIFIHCYFDSKSKLCWYKLCY